jgi:hypothetical protein
MKDSVIQPDETIEAMRFLWAMVGVSAGVIELVERRIEPNGERLTCRNRTTGALVTVSRSGPWTEAEERRYASALDHALNGMDDAEPIDAAITIERADELLAGVR